METAIKSERHFWATVNYIHHNPVKHGHVDKWTDWPYSSAEAYLKSVGKEQALKNWKEYDISEMGKDWDEF
jgi:putative transposase